MDILILFCSLLFALLFFISFVVKSLESLCNVPVISTKFHTLERRVKNLECDPKIYLLEQRILNLERNAKECHHVIHSIKGHNERWCHELADLIMEGLMMMINIDKKMAAKLYEHYKQDPKMPGSF